MTFGKIRSAAGLCKRSVVGDLFDAEGTLVSGDGPKADLLARQYSQVHHTGPDVEMDPFSLMVNERVAFLARADPLTHFGDIITADGNGANGHEFVRAEQVGEALRKRPGKKSSGADDIPDYVLKKTRRKTWRFLAILYNQCLNIGYFPGAWKQSVIVPILKPGMDPRQCASYRPISLLSAFGKLLEYFVLMRLVEDLTRNRSLLDCQFGFRRGHSTTHALMVFTDYVTKGLNRRSPTIAVSLDFEKAFDTAWREGIISKLIDRGIDSGVCRMISSFLFQRSFCVQVGETNSAYMQVTAGVPQGSLLGPVLYNVLMSDIPLPPRGDLLLVYADDILLAATGPRIRTVNARINGYLETLIQYFSKWRLRLNIRKSVAMVLRGRRKYLYPNCRSFVPSIEIGDELIPVSDRMKYLGVVFHDNFEYYRHMDRVLACTKRAFSAYCAVLGHGRGLDRRVGLLLYRQVIRPLMSYAFPVWFRISSAQMERLRVWERRILIACLGLRGRRGSDGIYRSPSCRSIYRAIDFERIDTFLIRSGLAFLEKARFLGNSLVRRCFDGARTMESVGSSRYMSPVDLLTLGHSGLLFEGEKLLFYHRRIGTLDIENLVYNTAQ